MVKASPFIHQPDRVARKVSDVSATDWQYKHSQKKKKTILFQVCFYGFSQGLISLYNTVAYIINSTFSLLTLSKYLCLAVKADRFLQQSERLQYYS